MRIRICLAVVLGYGAAGPAAGQCLLDKLTLPNGTGFGWALAAHGHLAAINRGTKASVHVFDVLSRQSVLHVDASDAPGTSGEFGRSVDLDDEWLIVGAPDYFGDGSVSVFDLSSGVEIHQLRPSNPKVFDEFGDSVAVAGDVVVVGAPGVLGSDVFEGAVYVFDLATGQELLEITVPGSYHLGWELDVSGDVAIVAEYEHVHLFDLKTGARIHELIPSSGSLQGCLHAIEVAIEGSRAVVGDRCDHTLGRYAGAAYLFDVHTGRELFTLLGAGWKSMDEFGSVALHADRVLVGGWAADNVTLFDASTGAETGTIEPPGIEPGDGMGRAVALTRDRALLGAPGDDDQGPNAGAVYLYRLGMPVIEGYCGPAKLNSTGLSGTVSAAPEPADCDGLWLAAEHLPPQQIGTFLTSRVKDFVPFVGGSQGSLCLGGVIGFFAEDAGNTGPNGLLRLRVATTSLPQPFGDVGVQPGETWYFQAWFRDANPGPTSNFTDAVAVTFR